MTVLMPSAEWSLEPLRPALTMLFRRLDKIFVKIDKIPTMRVTRTHHETMNRVLMDNLQKNLKWDACAGLLQGVFLTLRKCPYIVHVQHLRSLVNTCQVSTLCSVGSATPAGAHS
jgi:protein unc-80